MRGQVGVGYRARRRERKGGLGAPQPNIDIPKIVRDPDICDWRAVAS
jgi:hypothetical protein